MSEMIKFENLHARIIEIKDQKALLDVDVAEIYGVETKRINEAVKNNPAKFPSGYIIELDKTEWDGLKSKFSTSTKGGKVKLPTAFPEKGLYMLATILKSTQAVQATLAIIETFSRIRELSRNVKALSNVKDKTEQQNLMQKSGEMIAELLDDDLQTTDTETSIELNFAVLKFKHTIKKKKKMRKISAPIDILCHQLDEDDLPLTRILKAMNPTNHMLFSGWRDNQTSADAYIGGKYNGAFSFYFCKHLRDVQGGCFAE